MIKNALRARRIRLALDQIRRWRLPIYARARHHSLRFVDRIVPRVPRASETGRSQHLSLLRADVRVIEQGGYFLHSRWSPSGVTDQFLLDADTYHDRYFNRLDFLGLADQCLTAAAIDRMTPLKVLDVGSGGGSSVFALAKLLPNAEVIASDISPQLLGKLVTFAATRPELRARISAYCFDLHQPFFRENVFDLIVGSAILHHLADPLAALRHVAHSLKPGGRIVLVEPLEAGNLLLSTMYEAVLVDLQRRGAANHPIAKLMVAMRTDIHARLGVPVRKPWTESLDDKWVFSRPYLSGLASALHCGSTQVLPGQSDLLHVYEESFRSLLADSGNGDVEIPEYVLSTVRRFDSEISAGLKEHLCPTGIVIFRK